MLFRSEKCLKLSEVFPIEWNLNDGSVKFNVLTDDIFSWNINSLTIDKFLENIHPNDINKIQFDKLYSLSLPEDNFTIDLRLKRDFNAYSWYEFRLFIVNRDASGKPMLLRGVAINIDSRKAKELALENQTKQSGAGNFNQEIYSNFIPDLRTHLHSIVGFSEIIAMEDDNIKRLKYFENIKHNNEKLLKNIDDLVEINEEVNNIKLNETSINLWEYFVEIQQIYSLKNPDINKIKIGFISPYDSNTYLLDKERLSAIIDSMIISSINNTTSGYIHFGYNVENDILKLYVNDTSNNISSEDVEIFNNASEYSDIDDTPFKIELFNSKTIAQVMDGNISISIRPEGGVTYLLELNIKKSGSNSESLHKAPENKIVKPTILIAEDVIYSFQMLKVILEDRFNVIHAENGEEAVELFEKEKPAFIFMDVKMPVLDGIEATKRIRKISPDIPIVILTAYAVRSLKKQAADAGCTELLTKPCTSKQINACIKKHIHFRSK